MGGGYVLDFSNRTIHEFILDNTHLNIYDKKYNYGSGSKAKRLRAFWNKEPNYTVGKLISAMLKYWKANCSEITKKEQDLFDECPKRCQVLNCERI